MADKQSDPDAFQFKNIYTKNPRDALPSIPEDITAKTVFPKVDKTSFTPQIPAAGTAENDDKMRSLEQTIGEAVAAGITFLAGILKLGKTLPTTGVTGVPDPANMLEDTMPDNTDDTPEKEE